MRWLRGLLPGWSVAQAQSLSDEVSAALTASGYRKFMAHMWGSEPAAWQDDFSICTDSDIALVHQAHATARDVLGRCLHDGPPGDLQRDHGTAGRNALIKSTLCVIAVGHRG